VQQIKERRPVFSWLEELNFSFNHMEELSALLYFVEQFPRLNCLLVTGNPFALKGDAYATHKLENVLSRRTNGTGRIINESLN
jgi:hypothetical protein